VHTAALIGHGSEVLGYDDEIFVLRDYMLAELGVDPLERSTPPTGLSLRRSACWS